MEFNCGGSVLVRGFIDGGPEVGEKLEGNKVVRLITLVRVEVVGTMGPHGRPRQRWREVDGDGDAPVINIGKGPTHEHQ
jgi:hypothetical protein